MHRPNEANDGFEGSGGKADARAEQLWTYVEALKREGGPADELAPDLGLPHLLPAFPYRPLRNGANGAHGNGHANGHANGNGNGHGAAGREPDLNELAALAAAVYRTMQADGAEVARACPDARARLEAAIHAEGPLFTGEAVAAGVAAPTAITARPWWRAFVPAREAPAHRGLRDRRLVLACLLLTGLCAIALALWVRNRALAPPPDAGGSGAAFVGSGSAQPAAVQSLNPPGKPCK